MHKKYFLMKIYVRDMHLKIVQYAAKTHTEASQNFQECDFKGNV